MTLSPSPATAARKFAARYPRFAGVLLVQSMTPAGKAGWSLKSKKTPYFCRDGRARQTLLRRARDWRFNHRNGPCPVCGEIYLEPSVFYCRDAAGLGLMACFACHKRHGLQPLALDEVLGGERSTLAIHDPNRIDIVLDIRSVQSQLAASPDILPSTHFLPQWSALNA